MTEKITITDRAERFVAMKRKLGYRFTRTSWWPLRSFARFAEDRDETFIRAACKTLIDSERRKNTQASSDVGARQLARF